MMQTDDRLVLEELHDQHPIHLFACEDEEINEYLRVEALVDMKRSVARTFVVIDSEQPAISNIAGFFTLRADALRIKETYFEDWMDNIGDADKTKLDEIDVPLVELMWLARDLRWKGVGIGDFLMFSALKVVKNAADCVGLIGLHLRTTERGRRLYARYMFQEFTEHPVYDKRRYILSIHTLRSIVERLEDRPSQDRN